MNQFAPAVTHYKAIRERLIAEYEDLDEETLADTLEGLSDLPDMIAAIVRAALDDEAHAEGLKGRIEDMQARRERLLNRAKKRRQLACDVMVEADLKKVAAADLTLSVRAGTAALIVVDEAAVPQDYWVPVAPKLDRRSLLDRLKAGTRVEGVALSNPAPVLSVRTR